MSNNQKALHAIDENVNKITELVFQKQEIWQQYVLFDWRWWVGVVLSLFPWFIWARYRKKESTHRYLFVAFIVMLISVFLDVLGDQFGLWHYRYNVIPVVPTYFPWDFVLMPVVIISLLQYKPEANTYLKAAIFALGSSYVGEPLFHLIDVYYTIHWKFTYSVPIQFCLFLLSHRIYISKFHVSR